MGIECVNVEMDTFINCICPCGRERTFDHADDVNTTSMIRRFAHRPLSRLAGDADLRCLFHKGAINALCYVPTKYNKITTVSNIVM